jgi:hypothetical protein
MGKKQKNHNKKFFFLSIKKRFFLIFFFFFIFLESEEKVGETKKLFASSKFAHLEPLINFKIISSTNSKYHSRSVNEHHDGQQIRDMDGHIQPFADKLHLQFEIFEQQFSHQLELMTDFIEPNSKITVHKQGKH